MGERSRERRERRTRNAHVREASAPLTPSPKTLRILNRPILQFVLGFIIFVGVFQFLFYQFVVGSPAFRSYLTACARMASLLLQAAGENAAVHGDTLAGRFVMSLEVGCDGLQPMAILASAVLAFPSSPLRKAAGILVGSVAIFGLNVIRIVSLFWLGASGSPYFQSIHVHVWPALLILVALLLWAIWARRSLVAPARSLVKS